MATDIDLSQLDKRLVERLIKKGLLTEKDWDKHVKTLPDRADEAAEIETQFEPGAAESDED